MGATLVGLEVDDAMLADYIDGWTKEQKKIMKATYAKTISIIKKEARKKVKQLKTASGAPVKTERLVKGVRQCNWKNAKGASVYIRSPNDRYFELLFFESGTTVRSKGRKGGYRNTGRIKPSWFFQNTLNEKVKDLGPGFELEFANQLKLLEQKAQQKYSRGGFSSQYAHAKGRR